MTACVALALAASFSAAAPADDARGLLQRMEQALATRNYQGKFVHEHDGQTETLEIVHRVEGDGFAERLVSLDGSGREVIRRNGELRAYFPDRHVALVENDTRTGLLFSGLQGLDGSAGQMYRLSEESPTRISGREARVLLVEPLDDMRYGYRVWIDEASGMPLKTQLRTASGRTLEQLVFTDLKLLAQVPDAALEPDAPARKCRLLHRTASGVPEPQQAADTTWDAADLPPGFRLVANSTRLMGNRQRAVTHLVFSDGLASVSVFVEPRSGRPAAEPPDDLPVPQTVTRVGSSSAVSTEVDGHKVTAIGEVPPATVRAIAGSLRPGFAPGVRPGARH
ncbi:MAG: MucB/RseB C-terminal domain-containing protein [Gammaproteobacteria bacterium]|nr:MucB/RseB C-terminal domain-containing protein [Gammaproteobacteria bacterium]MDE2252130.1 MucB/RseB C-terminal domain-containing protein [Gammaproteobacteria bacterium]